MRYSPSAAPHKPGGTAPASASPGRHGKISPSLPGKLSGGFPHKNNDNLTTLVLTVMSENAASNAQPNDPLLQKEVAELIVSALNLDVAPADIAPGDSLYGEGLGLDSIDILEVALVVSKRYGFQLRADNEDNVRIFSSLDSLTRHIASHRTK